MKRPSSLSLVLLLGFFVFALLIFASGLGLGYSLGWRAGSERQVATAQQQPDASHALPQSDGTAMPRVSMPGTTAPSVTAPSITGPRVTSPQVTGPRVSGGQISGPSMRAPTLTAPAARGPSVSGAGTRVSAATAADLAARPSDGGETAQSAEPAPEPAPAEPAAEEAATETDAAAQPGDSQLGEAGSTQEETGGAEATGEPAETSAGFDLTTGSIGAPLRLYPLASPAAPPEDGAPAPAPESEAARAGQVQRFASADTAAAEGSFFAVEVGLFSHRENATGLAERLVSDGRRPLVVLQAPEAGSDSGDWFSVTLGRYAGRAEAERLRELLRQEEGLPGRVVLVTQTPEEAS